MKVIIAGSRTYTDYENLKSYCNKRLLGVQVSEIVSGTAYGADKLGERYAKEYGIPIKSFIPDWHKYGKAAGYKRNAEMAQYADVLIAFWDMKSKGTGHMIDLAKKNNLKVFVVDTNK